MIINNDYSRVARLPVVVDRQLRLQHFSLIPPPVNMQQLQLCNCVLTSKTSWCDAFSKCEYEIFCPDATKQVSAPLLGCFSFV